MHTFPEHSYAVCKTIEKQRIWSANSCVAIYRYKQKELHHDQIYSNLLILVFNISFQNGNFNVLVWYPVHILKFRTLFSFCWLPFTKFLSE